MSVNGMKITDVVVYPIRNKTGKSKLFAFAKVVLNDQFIIHGIRIYEGDVTGEGGSYLGISKEGERSTSRRGSHFKATVRTSSGRR